MLNCSLKTTRDSLVLRRCFVVFCFFLVCGFRHRIGVWWVVETNHGFLLFLWRPMWADFLLLKASFILIRSKWWTRGFFRGKGYLLKRITLFTHSFLNRKGFSSPQHWILHFVWLTQHRFGVPYLEIPVLLFYISKLHIKKKKPGRDHVMEMPMK